MGIKANTHAHAKKSSILVIVSFRSFSEPFPYFRVILRLFQCYLISGLFQCYFRVISRLFSYSKVISGLSYRGGRFRGGRKRIL